MPLFTDQVGNIISLPNHPKRIISLVPSQTELLHYLGLEDEVIGITKFCVHPQEWFRNKARIGGTKTVNLEKIRQLQPDLILANKEENTKEHIEQLQGFVPVWVSDIKCLDNALEMINEVGKLVNRESDAIDLAFKIKTEFDKLEISPPVLSAAYLIWKEPYMAAGGDTFINDMMKYCGLKNIFENQLRYPQISTFQLSTVNCQLLLLSSEPYPFKQKHIEELQALLPNTKIILVDGEMFSWYGSRLLLAASYFRTLIQLII